MVYGVLLALLLVAAGGGGQHATVAARRAVAPRYLSASEVMASWQTVLPNSPVPSAILDHCSNGPDATGKVVQAGNKLCCTSLEGYKECVEACWDYYPKDQAAQICNPGCQEAYRCVTVSGDDECPKEHISVARAPFRTNAHEDEDEDPYAAPTGRAAAGGASDHSHDGGGFDPSDMLFSEDLLIPGSKVTQCIRPSMPTWRVPFLRRDLADSIPISTENFTDIMATFAPQSLAMSDRIRSTLDMCEHPHLVKGERQACAASVESMVEFAASVLGTRDLWAFSSPDAPAAGVPASPAPGKYAVAAVRAVTAPGEASRVMACHGTAFPYAVFYCHAVNPTRAYEVTLRRLWAAAGEDAPPTFRALAVCHLDTSGFDPETPYFVEHGIKPGDAPVCHFLSRDSILWTPAASTPSSSRGQQQVAAQ